MTIAITRQLAGILSMSFLLVFLTGCPDPNKRADEIMAKQGVNRLRKPNDYMQPGSVIVVKDKKAVYADNMVDYIEGPPINDYPIQTGNEVIPKEEEQKGMTADVALKFLDSFLPVKVTGKMALTSEVKIDMTSAKVKRMKIQDVRRFLNRTESQSFKDQMLENINQGKEIYIGYQTYMANKIKLTASAGSDISTGAEIGKIAPLFEGAEPKFAWKKTSKTEIIIDGEGYYVFGVKTAKLSYDKNTKKWSIDETKFSPKGVLAVGTDNIYAYAPTGSNPTDFRVVDIERIDPTKKP
ncbi:MAG: hypothetical protein MOB07_24465 [Acidobacteria bacterium]|nr:hypothetical protein [Acidobacteriota bacterium]